MSIRKLLMIPGPTPVARSIQDEMGRETVAFGDPQFVKDFKEVIEDMKEMWGAKQVYVVAGSGSLAMEMGIANTVARDEKILIASNGFFGDRFVDVIERKGIDFELMQVEWGTTVTPEMIDEKLQSGDFNAVTVTHVDTSTGVVAPVEEIGKMLNEKYPDVMYIVDGVCATAAEPEHLEDMHIDILISGSQKAFGVAPGLAFVWASQKALDKRESLGTIPEYFADFKKWTPIMDDPSKYYATPPVNLVWALQESLRLIKEEGLQNRYDRHRKMADAIQKALESYGFKLLAQEGVRASTLSNIIYMDGVDDMKFRETMREEGAEVAGGLGDYAGKMFRWGHMGNIDEHDVVGGLAAIDRTLMRLGIDVEPGKAIGVFTKEYAR